MNRGHHLLRRRLLAFEVALQERVVRLHHRLHELGAGLRHLGLDLLGDLGTATDGAAPFVDMPFVGDDAHHAAQGDLGTDGHLEGSDAFAERVAQLTEHAGQRRALAVELAHEDHPGNTLFLCGPPQQLGLHLHAFDPGHHEEG